MSFLWLRVAQLCRANSAIGSRRSTVPVSFLGIIETNRITLGTLKSPKRGRQNAWSRSASELPLSIAAAQISSPYLASGTPKGCRFSDRGSGSVARPSPPGRLRRDDSARPVPQLPASGRRFQDSHLLCDAGERRHAAADASAAGIQKEKTAPGPRFDSAHRRPPWASMIERLIASPSPMPCGLVV